MSNGDMFNPVIRPQVIADRIGPIFDPAFLKLIPREKLRDIVVIQVRAQLGVMQKEMEAMEEIGKQLEELKF